MNINDIYDYVKENTVGFDAVYEEHIIHLVGVRGLDILKENRLIESCGIISDRQLYVLCDKSCLSS